MSKRTEIILQEITMFSFLISAATAIIPSILWSYFLFKNSTLDKEATDKVRKILNDTKIKWEVRILNTKLPNALSSGEIRVYITKGCRDKLTLNETAAVMLHEIAHSRYLHIPINVAQTYGARALSQYLQKKIITKTIKLICDKGNNVLARQILRASLSWWMAPILFLLDYSLVVAVQRPTSYRKEKQADFFVINHGYGKYLASALKKLNKALNNYKPPNIIKPFLFLMTILNKHPELEERIKYCLDDKEFEKAIKSNNKNGAIKIFIKKLKVGKKE